MLIPRSHSSELGGGLFIVQSAAIGFFGASGGFPDQSGNRSFGGKKGAAGSLAENGICAAAPLPASSAMPPRKVLRSADNLAAFHHELHVSDRGDVAGRIAVECIEVGE